MNLVLFAIIALFAFAIGSFLNVLIVRKSVRKSLYGRSHCPGCKKTLSSVELIPLVSFLIQKGRCRTCGIALLWQYPLVELGTAALFVASFVIFSSELSFDFSSLVTLFLVWIGVSAGIIIFVYDLRYTIIPDYAVATLFVLGVVASTLRNFPIVTTLSLHNPFFADWATALSLSIFFAFLWCVSKGAWMGLGDAKLIFATSLILGFPASIAAFLFSFGLGALASVALIIFNGRSIKSKIPFGPFILTASVLAYFFTPLLLLYYF